MISDNEKLWVVYRQRNGEPVRWWVFRTRDAARKFVDNPRRTKDQYSMTNATWGPDQ